MMLTIDNRSGFSEEEVKKALDGVYMWISPSADVWEVLSAVAGELGFDWDGDEELS